MTTLAIAGLDGTVGVGVAVTLVTAFVTLLTLLVNALLKVGTRSDAINQQIVAAKDAEMERLRADHERELEAKDRDLAAMRTERDMWFHRATGGSE